MSAQLLSPKEIPFLGAWREGLTLNTPELDRVPYADLLMLAAAEPEPEHDLLFLFVKNQVSPFVVDARHIDYPKFPDSGSGLGIAVFRCWLKQICQSCPNVFLNATTRDFLDGRKLPPISQDPASFAYDLGKSLVLAKIDIGDTDTLATLGSSDGSAVDNAVDQTHTMGHRPMEPTGAQDLTATAVQPGKQNLFLEIPLMQEDEEEDPAVNSRVICPKCYMYQEPSKACTRCGRPLVGTWTDNQLPEALQIGAKQKKRPAPKTEPKSRRTPEKVAGEETYLAPTSSARLLGQLYLVTGILLGILISIGYFLASFIPTGTLTLVTGLPPWSIGLIQLHTLLCVAVWFRVRPARTG